jgi:hypothetical protein
MVIERVKLWTSVSAMWTAISACDCWIGCAGA